MRRFVLAVAVFIAVVIGVNVGANEMYRSWDLTAERSGTLSNETLRVLRDVHRRIEVTSLYPRDAVGRVEAATLLSRYRKANRLIQFRIVDPTLDPGEAQRLGVVEIGSAAVQDVSSRDKIEIAQLTIEIDVTSAIARVVRGVDATVCFASGHAERDPSSDAPSDLGSAHKILVDNGYRTLKIDLLARPRVPRSCDVVVVAAPMSPLGSQTVKALRTYLRRSGKALLLGDPSTRVDLSKISSEWGIRFLYGVVVEADPDSHLRGDATVPIVHQYSEASPPVRGLGPTFFPRTEGVRARDIKTEPGLTTAEIAYTTQLSYLDRANIGKFSPKVDRRGPVAIAAAADQSEVAGTRILRTRILSFGDVDFATNDFIGDAANAQLWIQGIDWLTQPEQLVTAVPNFPKVRNLDLTEARSRYVLLLMAGIVPGLFVIAGGFVWVFRRGR
jgi:gliding motility-associatede transport system auxiliary component